jgi:hypothetical protein
MVMAEPARPSMDDVGGGFPATHLQHPAGLCPVGEVTQLGAMPQL